MLPDPVLLLTQDEISCTEAWLQLTSANIQLPNNITLLINGGDKKTFSLSIKDSLLYIDSLLPNQTYSFRVSSIQSAAGGPVSSNELSVTTLDTTSHNFTWQTFEFGQHSSSILYDVAVINENNIWAVGEIYMNDSLGNPDPTSYNAVHWNGQIWELKKIGGYGGWPCRTVFAFAENDVWFEGVIFWNSVNYTEHSNGFPLEPNGDGWIINKMWGSNSNNLYAVGNNGNIAHYQNGSWTKIESGTDLNFRDIYGSTNIETNELEIIALASNSGVNQRKEIISIKNQTVETLPDSGLANYLSTVWFISGRKYCIGGQGYYESRTFGPVWERNTTIPQFHITSIRGAGLNDIVLGGSFGLLMHYNGVNWMNYAYITASYFDVISEVAIKGNTIVAAGFKGSKAVVMIGKR